MTYIKDANKGNKLNDIDKILVVDALWSKYQQVKVHYLDTTSSQKDGKRTNKC